MSTIRCPFCHENVESSAYPAHEAEHLQARPDGQQSEYVTLPPEEREEGSLAGVPKVYRHKKCGAATGMPEEIIRSYLKNPYLYMADATFCCGCGTHVPFRECVWVDTGEDLQTYTDKLRAAKPQMKPKGCFGVMVVAFCLVIALAFTWGAAVGAGDAKKALAAWQGVWKLEAIESDDDAQEMIRKPPRWVIKGNKVFYGGEELAVLTLDPGASPKTIDLEFAKPKRTYEGVYTLAGDTLKICVNKMTDGVKERPLGFKTKGKADWRLLIFKRLKEPNAAAIEHLSGFAGIAIGINKQKELFIANVLEGTPAKKAGLLKDDLILKVAGRDATDLRTTVRMVGEFRPGSEVTFRIKRGGKEQDIKVKVGVLPFFFLD